MPCNNSLNVPSSRSRRAPQSAEPHLSDDHVDLVTFTFWLRESTGRGAVLHEIVTPGVIYGTLLLREVRHDGGVNSP